MKILIIEDEPGIINFLQQGLQEEGYEVVSAVNGIDGLRIAENTQPNLILLDWLLPDIEGIEVCRALRDKMINCPVIFLTAKDTVQETVEGLRAGANDYIKKPFNFEELLERIRVQLRTVSTNKELTAGPIVITNTSHKITCRGLDVHLTQKEYDLLYYLIQNKGVVCTRKDIIENVWDIHFEYDTGIIDVFINAIRKKLNLHKDDDVIKTIRGIGYIIED